VSEAVLWENNWPNRVSRREGVAIQRFVRFAEQRIAEQRTVAIKGGALGEGRRKAAF
jgi:hypothetical protein